MRIDFGPGYRVYYAQVGASYVLLLAGDKGSQKRDIAKAQQLASEFGTAVPGLTQICVFPSHCAPTIARRKRISRAAIIPVAKVINSIGLL